MTPPILDLDSLLAPVPGPDPAGRSVPFELRQKLDDARKEIDPSTFDPKDPLRPSEAVKADWPLIIKTTRQILTATSKDLLIAARLTEALTKQHGYAGVRDGMTLMRRLIEECWDRIIPVIEEEDDIESRGAAFYWLDDPDRGARFPYSLRTVPLVANEDHRFGWLDWKQNQSEKDERKRAAFNSALDKAFQQTPRETFQAAVDDLKAAVTETNGVAAALNQRMGTIAPSLIGLRGALDDCLALAEQMLARKGPAAPSATDDQVAPGTGAAPAPAEAAPTAAVPTLPAVPTRAQVYRQIAAAAQALRDIEPHSPIPFLLERAVELGGLSFPELMKVLVRDATVLAAMNRELGIKEEKPS